MVQNNITEVRQTPSSCRLKRRFVCAFTLMVGLSTFPLTARADARSGFWSDYLVQASRCQAALNKATSEGTRCLAGNGLKLFLEEGLRLTDAYGKNVFGQHFQVAGNLTHSPISSKIDVLGDVDVVLPFTGVGLAVGRPGSSSFFFQQGVTRSWDGSGSGSGLFRNDFRQGVVRRFRLARDADADILGVSAFHLLSLERGHRVLAPGVDYAGRWGTGSLRYFVPITGWRPGSSGYEERAIEGVEVGLRFALTTTVRLNAVGYRWQAEDGSDEWNSGARVNLDWRPHPWLNFGVGYSGIGGGEDSTTFRVALRVPFGSSSKPPSWEGIGVAASFSQPTVSDLWRPIDDIGAIRVATRNRVSELVENARFRFLENSVGTGGEVQLEVLLPAAAPEDIRVVVRLVPGGGENPAVPGQDFVDEPVETTIRQGTNSSTVSVQLLQNDNLEEVRTLTATVSIAS